MSDLSELPHGFLPEDERIALAATSGPLPTEDEATCLRMLTPLMKRYAVLERQRAQDEAVYEAEVKVLRDRWAAIDQKNDAEQNRLLPLIEAWGRALLAHDDTRKSRELQYGRIQTRHVAARYTVEDEAALAEELQHYGYEVPYNKAPKPTVSLSKLEGIIAVLPHVPPGVVLVPSEERFSLEVAR